LAAFCWTKSPHCKYAFYQGFHYSEVFHKILHNLQVRKFGSLPAVRTTCHTVRTPSCPMHQPFGRRDKPSERRGFPSGPSSVSKSFELLQLASVRTFQQPVGTNLSVRPSFIFSFQNQIWVDCRNCPDDVDSIPDALLLKASSQFKLNRPDASLPWSERAYDRYENCV
jgi:hypothetical protein